MRLDEGRTLVIAAHPDDEVLGAGGLMATYPGACVVIVSEGTSNETPEPGPDYVCYDVRLDMKRYATRAACQVLQSVLIREGDFRDQQMELKPPLTRWIEQILTEIRPTTVVTHCPTDLNSDHRVVAEAVAIATRPFTNPGSTVSWLLGFHVDVEDTPWSASRYPTLALPLDESALRRKLDALRCYAKEMRPWPHPRSFEAIEHHARWCGSVIGVPAAEPYMLIRGVLR